MKVDGADGSGSGTAACFAVRLTGLVMGREALALACVALNCARRSRSADALAGPSVVSVAVCEGIGEPFKGAAGLTVGFATEVRVPERSPF